MAWDWIVKLGAWIYGVNSDELAKIEGALPALSRLGLLAKEVDPLLKQTLAWYTRAQPLIDDALPLVEEVVPVLKSAAPLIEKARVEVEGLLPVYNTILDVLERHRTAGTNGIREVQYTLQSAYPARSDEDTIASVNTYLTSKQIRDVQIRLKVSVDGIFGKQSLAAVKDFQKQHGLAVDGFPGKVTQAVLEAIDESR